MIFIVAFFICCFGLFQVYAADEPLIPAPLNAVLLKIQPGMTTNQVVAVLAPSYPKATAQMGDWSGQSGYIEYKLDDKFTLSVASATRDGKELVHDDVLNYVFDWPITRRITIELYHRDGQTRKEPPKK